MGCDGPSHWSSDSLIDAQSLQLAITTTDFLCSLVVTSSCLKYLQALTYNLQAEARDIVDAVQEISSVKAALNDARGNVETQGIRRLKRCTQILVYFLIRPVDVSGTPIVLTFLETTHQRIYYCHTISIPLLDYMLFEMESRFSLQTALLGFYVVPSIMLKSTREDCSQHLSRLAEMYNYHPLNVLRVKFSTGG